MSGGEGSGSVRRVLLGLLLFVVLGSCGLRLVVPFSFRGGGYNSYQGGNFGYSAVQYGSGDPSAFDTALGALTIGEYPTPDFRAITPAGLHRMAPSLDWTTGPVADLPESANAVSVDICADGPTCGAIEVAAYDPHTLQCWYGLLTTSGTKSYGVRPRTSTCRSGSSGRGSQPDRGWWSSLDFADHAASEVGTYNPMSPFYTAVVGQVVVRQGFEGVTPATVDRVVAGQVHESQGNVHVVAGPAPDVGTVSLDDCADGPTCAAIELAAWHIDFDTGRRSCSIIADAVTPAAATALGLPATGIYSSVTPDAPSCGAGTPGAPTTGSSGWILGADPLLQA